VTLPSHLWFLKDLASATPRDLAEFFPETASGDLTARPNEIELQADGITYLGSKDGRMVPITAENLEPMEDNLWDPTKFATLVDAIEAGEQPTVHPGYADIFLEHGELTAHVQDGNHRTFAPIAAGSDFSWVMISDRTAQELDDPKNGALYKAIRAAQRAAGVPLFKRRTASRVKESVRDALLDAERSYAELQHQVHLYQQAMLKQYGPANGGSRDLRDQLERPQTYWRMRLKELSQEHGSDWVYDNIYSTEAHQLVAQAQEQLTESFSDLYDMRKRAGLGHGERLDPKTGKVVR
jgi:hypothetical protein